MLPAVFYWLIQRHQNPKPLSVCSCQRVPSTEFSQVQKPESAALGMLQEFCLFAVVGLVSDFFLQMFFFTTVLSIDIRRMEVSFRDFGA